MEKPPDFNDWPDSRQKMWEKNQRRSRLREMRKARRFRIEKTKAIPPKADRRRRVDKPVMSDSEILARRCEAVKRWRLNNPERSKQISSEYKAKKSSQAAADQFFTLAAAAEQISKLKQNESNTDTKRIKRHGR